MKTFSIKVNERFDITFSLAVFKTRKEMLAAIKKNVPAEAYGGNGKSDGRTKGMFHPTPQLINSGVPGTCFSNMFGTMYLNLADLTDEVIAHECAHAAFSFEYNVRHYDGTFGDDDFDEQESYCYFLGKAVEKVKEVINKNYKTGRSVK